MAPWRGWAAKGKRLIGKAPFGHWNNTTFIGALRHDGITAPWVIDGPINGSILPTHVAQVLTPTLRPIMSRGRQPKPDSLESRTGPAIRKAIKTAGAKLLLLPASSPVLNKTDLHRQNGPQTAF
ncbi:MAG: transposase [Alphaproteobacteria bacterium]